MRFVTLRFHKYIIQELFRSVGPWFVVLLKFFVCFRICVLMSCVLGPAKVLVCFRICVFMPCVFRCGFSLIFERGLEKDICLHRITQKSTWSGLGRLDRPHLLYDTDETAFEILNSYHQRRQNVRQF